MHFLLPPSWFSLSVDGYFVNFHTILECGELDFPVELTIV